MPVGNVLSNNIYYPVQSHPESPLQAFCSSFIKDTSAAPVAQIIDTVPFRPTCVIFFSSGCSSQNTLTSAYETFIGFAVDKDSGKSAGMGVRDNTSGTGNAGRYHSSAFCCMRNDRLGNAVAGCNFIGFTDKGFVINWTSNEATAQIISFLALGGVQANVAQWAFAASGSKSITGVGFKPDVVIHIATRVGSIDTASSGLGSLDFGWMQTNTGQRSIGATISDSSVTDNSHVRYRDDRFIVDPDSNTGAATNDGTLTSMDDDGFTVNLGFSAALQVISLCLKGVQTETGTFTKTTTTPAPQSQVVTSSLAFMPKAVLFIAADLTINNISGGTGYLYFAFGATSGPSNSNCFACSEKTSTLTSDNEGYDATKAIAIVDPVTPSVKYECDLESFDANGFTVSWTTINNVASKDIVWLALG